MDARNKRNKLSVVMTLAWGGSLARDYKCGIYRRDMEYYIGTHVYEVVFFCRCWSIIEDTKRGRILYTVANGKIYRKFQ